ncbi:putative porin [Gracilimonas mengyeensis]|uniref:Porin n=1 Tax=Gracilimonas mengyeensis TaxID=1302730 RepID=A0A521D783_9BACT|nr:putative porin [Gracilimonas mengyeensis]SMO67549.1 hypothetical protein SAMN06265219_107181 [Gracilimonas mengyeensis]
MALPLYAQQQDSTETIPAAEIDSLQAVRTDSSFQESPPEPKAFDVAIWEEPVPVGANPVTNDSLMRWQIWPGWGDYQAYRRDVISFRQGTSGRVDAYHINGYEPHEQELKMEGLLLNNPVTGLPNYNLVPHRKIGRVSENFGGGYRSSINIRDYYIVKPISFLNYDEAGGNYRNLEFLVARNFTERTNVELSYWDRRGGGYYPNSEVEGSQIMGRIYHHLSPNYLIRGMYLRNQLQRDEPFGYNIGNPETFAFDEFRSVPVSSNGNADFLRWDLVGGIYHRADTSSMEDAGLEISISKNNKEQTGMGDTLAWDVWSLNTGLFKTYRFNRFEIRGEADFWSHSSSGENVLTNRNWTILEADVSGRYYLGNQVELFGMNRWQRRSDDFSGYELSGGLKGAPGPLRFTMALSSFSRMPSMQSLYWNSYDFSGNEALDNETGFSAAGKVQLKVFPSLDIGVSGRYKSAENAVFITPDSSYTNSEAFESVSGTAFAAFENHRFEIESSATVQQFAYSDESSPVAMLNNRDQILWLRNSAFVKGYVFDRAAYLKLGAKTLLSPFYYAARTYNAGANFWQGNSTYNDLPPFFRLDAELSARVRAIMVVIRWENALDGIGQAGYFEAAGYPMPPRRLMVGIRAQFRN